MKSLLECVPNFAFAGADLKVFEFPKYHLYVLQTEDDLEIWIKGKGPKSLTQNLPSECREGSKCLKALGKAYMDGGETRLLMYARWVPVAHLLEDYIAGQEVFCGVSFSDGISTLNIGDLLFEGSTSDWLGSSRKALAQELLEN